MKKLLAGTFAAGVLLAMGFVTGADAYTVWVDQPVTRVTSVSYTTYQPTYYSPVTYSSYSSNYSSSYYVDTVSCLSDGFTPVRPFRSYGRTVRWY